MKKVFFGLAVAVVALSASAFTNEKSKSDFSFAYIVDYDQSTQEYIFAIADPGSIPPCTTPGYSLPCQIIPITYSLPTGTNRIEKFLVESPYYTAWVTTTDFY